MSQKIPGHYLAITSIFILLACNEKRAEQTASIQPADTVNIAQVEPAGPVPDDKISSIRNEVNRINQMNLMVESFRWQQDGCVDEGKVNYYLNNDTIVKVAESGFIGDGGWTKAYYYKDGKFIFSFMQHIGGPAGMPVDTSEIRIYADSDTLVLQKKNNEYYNDLTQKYDRRSVEYRLLTAYKDKNFAEIFCR